MKHSCQFSAILVAVHLFCTGCSSDAKQGSDDTAQHVPVESSRPLAGMTAVPVKVVKPEYSVINQKLAVPGLISAFRKATVAAEVSGQVISRRVEPGDKVSEGQLLITLDDARTAAALEEAVARVQSRRVDLAQAESELKRGAELRKDNFISRDRLDSLLFSVDRARSELAAARAAEVSARQAQADTSILAPFDGSAEAIHVHEGDYVVPGQPIVTLIDLSKARVRAGVSAREAEMIAGLETARVIVDNSQNLIVTGRVQSVARMSESASGNYPVEVWIEGEATEQLRDGMIATVVLPSDLTDQHLTIPSTAVFRRDGRPFVFVVDGQKQAHLREVQIGQNDKGLTEILDGLTSDDTVVVDGQFALSDGARVALDRK